MLSNSEEFIFTCISCNHVTCTFCVIRTRLIVYKLSALLRHYLPIKRWDKIYSQVVVYRAINIAKLFRLNFRNQNLKWFYTKKQIKITILIIKSCIAYANKIEYSFQ